MATVVVGSEPDWMEPKNRRDKYSESSNQLEVYYENKAVPTNFYSRLNCTVARYLGYL